MIEITIMCMAIATVSALCFAMERKKDGSKKQPDKGRKKGTDCGRMESVRVYRRNREKVFMHFTIEGKGEIK